MFRVVGLKERQSSLGFGNSNISVILPHPIPTQNLRHIIGDGSNQNNKMRLTRTTRTTKWKLGLELAVWSFAEMREFSHPEFMIRHAYKENQATQSY